MAFSCHAWFGAGALAECCSFTQPCTHTPISKLDWFLPLPQWTSFFPSVSLSQVSFDLAEYTANVDGVGTLRLLDAIKTCNMTDSVRFYQASTSELYGKVQEIPQKETTIFYPRSPYGNDYIYTDTVGKCKNTFFFGKDQQLTDTETAVFFFFCLCVSSPLVHIRVWALLTAWGQTSDWRLEWLSL